jgi:hypothetical protein
MLLQFTVGTLKLHTDGLRTFIMCSLNYVPSLCTQFISVTVFLKYSLQHPNGVFVQPRLDRYRYRYRLYRGEAYGKRWADDIGCVMQGRE